jgi:hypothetical protein
VPLILNLGLRYFQIHFCVGVCHDADVALQIERSRRVVGWATLVGTDGCVKALSSSRILCVFIAFTCSQCPSL